QMILETDATAIKALEGDVNNGLKKIEASLEAAEDYFVTAEGKAQIAKSHELFKKFSAKVDETKDLAIANKTDEAKIPLAQSRAIAKELGGIIDDLCQRKEVQAKESYEESAKAYANARILMIGFIVGGVIVGLGLGYV